jgi:lysophospholipase L1-like esterase
MRIVACVAVLVLPASPAAASPDGCKKIKQGARVLFVGDSNTQGGLLAEQDRYPNIVAESLGITSLNVALGGSVSADWVPWGALWQERVAPALPVDAMVVVLGTNDAYHVIGLTTYIGNIVSIIVGFEGDVYLLTPPPFVAFPWVIALYRALLMTVGDAMRRVCGVVDTHSLLNLPDDYVDAGLHLNEAGHQKLADSLVAELGESR